MQSIDITHRRLRPRTIYHNFCCLHPAQLGILHRATCSTALDCPAAATQEAERSSCRPVLMTRPYRKSLQDQQVHPVVGQLIETHSIVQKFTPSTCSCHREDSTFEAEVFADCNIFTNQRFPHHSPQICALKQNENYIAKLKNAPRRRALGSPVT